MTEYRSLKVLAFSAGLFGRGIKPDVTQRDYIEGAFKVGGIYGALGDPPCKGKSFMYRRVFSDLDALRSSHPELAEGVAKKVGSQENLSEISLYEAELFDDKILPAFDWLVHTVTIEKL